MDKPERHLLHEIIGEIEHMEEMEARTQQSRLGIVYDDEGRYSKKMLEYDKQLSGEIHIVVEGMYNYLSRNGGTPQDFQHLKAIAIETLLESMSGGYAAETTE